MDKQNNIWIQKYKPILIHNILGNSKSKYIFNYLLESKKVPFNFILNGP